MNSFSFGSFNEDINKPDPKVEVSAPLIMGDKDYFLRSNENADYVMSGKLKTFVTNLEIKEGSHFVQEHFPAQANYLIISFLKIHS